jgi:hypothetical protein
MRRPRGVVITPSDEAGQKVGLAVRHVLQELGVETYYFDEVRPGASWANAISDAIRAADFIVADISRPNSNVPTSSVMPTLCGSRAFSCAVWTPTVIHRMLWSGITTFPMIRAIYAISNRTCSVRRSDTWSGSLPNHDRFSQLFRHNAVPRGSELLLSLSPTMSAKQAWSSRRARRSPHFDQIGA